MFTGQVHPFSLQRASVSVLIMLICLLVGCKPKDQSQTPPNGSTAPSTAKPTKTASDDKVPEILPVPRPMRKYAEVDPRVNQAWYIVEAAYLVVGDKYKAANEMLKSKDKATLQKGAALKEEATQAIQHDLFGTNPKVVKLFEDSIADNPENPLNIASYALYLQPRKTYNATGYEEMYEKSLSLMDQAIKLWPDESDFYIVKVELMTSPLKVHEWTRSISLEEETIQARVDEVRRLLMLAEKYDPANAMINYWRAQLLARLTPTSEVAKVRDEILEQIKRGNSKPVGNFAYAPPCKPYPDEARFVQLDPASTDPYYYDAWMNFGYYDPAGELAIYSGVLSAMHWPQDKENVGAIMYMLYNMGRTKPFDTTYFSWQQKILTVMMDDPALSADEKAKLAHANFMLNDYYRETAQQLAAVPLLFDPTKFDVVGLSQLETTTTRQMRQREIIQPLHASYLHEVADVLGLPPFPLDPDPKHWGD